MKNLTLLIPAKNESESLPLVLNEIREFNCKKKIILSSNDVETIDAIKNYDVEIVYQKNLGYGDALISGINETETEYFCIFNADGSFIPTEINYMINYLEKTGSDFIFGSRYQNNSGSEDDTIITLIGNKVFTLIGNIFFNLQITDILYTFVVGKTISAKKLNLKKKDFAFCVELPIKAKKENMIIKSFSCYERERFAGTKKVNAFKDGFIILIEMIRFLFKR
jgi:glycosyltransferase involved in cell wall biosynthesis|tara:strand:- start:340 stop:1008 length:669 start_codon:yes stop_codon:yes gene_type:complete